MRNMTGHSGRLLAATIVLMCLAVSCESEPKYIYVPGPGFAQKLTVAAGTGRNGDLRVGEWLDLKATRTTGPWIRVERPKGNQPDCWWRRPPPRIEEDVQSNVTWHVEPSGYAVFNVPGSLNLRERSVRFTRPGNYKLSAASAGCGGPFGSNVIEVTVFPAANDEPPLGSQ